MAKADAYLTTRVWGGLLITFIVIFGAVNMCVAQEIQGVKSSQPIQCGGKPYQLRILIAETPIQRKLARSLAIVLTPADTTETKVFGIYWINAPDFSPTDRDDTNGRLGTTLFPYGDGNLRGVPVVESFFSEANCLSTDPQVIGIQTVIREQGQQHNSLLRAASLQVLATDLSSQQVSVRADEVENSLPEDLSRFNNIPNKIAFANALHGYARKFGAVKERDTQQSTNSELDLLKTNNAKLQSRVDQLEAEKAGMLGAAPLWLMIAFPFMVVLSLGGITFFGLALYHWIQRRFRKQNSDASSRQTTASGNGSPTTPVNLSPEIASGIQNIKGTLQTLTSDVVEMRKSVADFNSKLDARTKGNEALQSIWHCAYQTAYSSEQNDKLVKEVGQIVALFNWLRPWTVFPDASIQEAVEQLKRTVTRLNTIRKSYFGDQPDEWPFLRDIAEKIESKFASDAKRLESFKHIESEVRNFTGKDTNVSEVVTKLIDVHIQVQRKLERYEYPRDLKAAIDALFNVQQKVIDQVRRALPNQDGKMGELVTTLVDEYLKVKPEAERTRQLEAENLNLQIKLDQTDVELKAGKELANEIAVEFNLKPLRLQGDEAIAATLNRLKAERESSVYLQLRLGLSSALIAFEKTAKRTGSEERNELLEALHLHKVKDGIRKLLNEMEECTGEQLWHKGLSEGFSDKWLHYLIRADLLLRTYYVDHKEFGWLSKAVSLACSAILAALYEFQVEVVEVALLGERPKEMDTESVYPGLRNLSAVRDKVRLKIMNCETEELVVDVTSFPYFVKGVQENRGRAALANPSAWRQH